AARDLVALPARPALAHPAVRQRLAFHKPDRARAARGEEAGDVGGAVGAAIVDDNNLPLRVGRVHERGDARADVLGLVARGHDDRHERSRVGRRWRMPVEARPEAEEQGDDEGERYPRERGRDVGRAGHVQPAATHAAAAVVRACCVRGRTPPLRAGAGPLRAGTTRAKETTWTGPAGAPSSRSWSARPT